MFHLMNKSCPYGNWTSEARIHCSNPDDFHCVKDEYDRIGWVCVQPIWIEKERCPVFNLGVKELDSAICFQTKCPPYTYRSNNIDVEFACRYIKNTLRTTTELPFTTPSDSAKESSLFLIIAIALLILVLLVISIVAGMVLHKRRRKPTQNNDVALEQANLIGKAETSKKAKETTWPFNQANDILSKKKLVVITGVQGSGKTYLAKSLVNDLESTIKITWISNLAELYKEHKESITEMSAYVFDELFYELQTEQKLKDTVKEFEKFLQKDAKPYIILTCPTCIWQRLAVSEGFQPRFSDMHIDLDKINESEKRALLKSLMKRYNLSIEEAEKLCKSQDKLLKRVSTDIGFPGLISWVCSQSSEETIDKLVKYPLQSISDKVASLKKALTEKEAGKYLILAYMSIKDGKMDINNVDEKLFDILKEKYARGFLKESREENVRGMKKYYLSENKDGCFEIDLNILKKIVLVSIAKDDIEFFLKHCRIVYSRYVIRTLECPHDIDASFTECYIKI